MSFSCCRYCCKVPTQELKMCSGCCAVAYCNEECQKAHWRAHKAQCQAPKPLFWTESRARAFVEKIFPGESHDDHAKNMERLAESIQVTSYELERFIPPSHVARRLAVALSEEEVDVLLPPEVQAEMDEIYKNLKLCLSCGRGCGPMDSCPPYTSRHLLGWEIVD